jgi:hypothetical protein
MNGCPRGSLRPMDLWAQDGSWGYQTAFYMLSLIIRLQAVVEIIINPTASALELLARQQTQTHATIYQNLLAFDYLLGRGPMWQIHPFRLLPSN